MALSINVCGQDYPVEVQSDGKFYARINGQLLSADTFAELKQKANRAKVKISIPFSQERSDSVRHGTVTGTHAATGALLVRWDDGTTEQFSRYASGLDRSPMPRLTGDEVLELELKLKNLRTAQEAVDAFREAHAFPGGIFAAVRLAQSEAARDQAE